MHDFVIEYLSVQPDSYGAYTILKLGDIPLKELKSKPELADAIQESFGDRFVILREEAGKARDYILNEHIIGIPTPEFERQIKSANWKEKEIVTT